MPDSGEGFFFLAKLRLSHTIYLVNILQAILLAMQWDENNLKQLTVACFRPIIGKCRPSVRDCGAASDKCGSAGGDYRRAGDRCRSASDKCAAAIEKCASAIDDCKAANGDCKPDFSAAGGKIFLPAIFICGRGDMG